MISSFVITGFLGSGKTTFILNAVKEHLNNRKVAVIVNEFGEIGVDGKILQGAYSEVVEIEEGCICCKLTREFEISVFKLIEEYSPEIIIIESSGISEPFPIVFSLKTLNISVEGVLCLVDLKNFYNYKKDTTSLYQIGSSNIIILNKKDLVNEKDIIKIEREIKNIKENYKIENMFIQEKRKLLYKIYKSSYGRVPAEIFEGIGEPFIFRNTLHYHNAGIKSRIIEIAEDISYEELTNMLMSLPENIIRAKGIVKLKEYPYPLSIHYVFGDFELGEPVEKFDGNPFLVLIG